MRGAAAAVAILLLRRGYAILDASRHARHYHVPVAVPTSQVLVGPCQQGICHLDLPVGVEYMCAPALSPHACPGLANISGGHAAALELYDMMPTVAGCIITPCFAKVWCLGILKSRGFSLLTNAATQAGSHLVIATHFFHER